MITAWNLCPAVALNTLFFIIGAEPIDLKRTTTIQTESAVRPMGKITQKSLMNPGPSLGIGLTSATRLAFRRILLLVFLQSQHCGSIIQDFFYGFNSV